jgi:hypothetical protein
MTDVSYPGPPGSPQYPQDPQYPQGGFGQVPQQGPPQGAFGQTPPPGGYRPPPGGGGYTQPPGGYLPTPPKKKAPTVRIVIGAVAAVVVIVVIVVALVQRQSAPSTAAVNDCMQRTGTDSIKKVDCTDPNWNYKVVGKVDNVTESDWQKTAAHPTDSGAVCENYKSATASYWEGTEGGQGYVLCLQERAGTGASPATGG